MADQQQVNEDPEVIRRRMEQTRSSLAEKLEVLEQKVANTVEEATSAVSETVHEAKEAVAETVETVKETVTSTVETVKETLDFRAHVRNHPWTAVGGSVAVGFLGGWLMGPEHPHAHAGSHEPAAAEPEAEPEREAAWSGPSHQPAREHRGWLNWLQSTFGAEIDKLKGLAIGTVAGVVRDLVGQAVPENLRPMVTDMINSVTTKLGGETIKERIIPETEPAEETSSRGHASSYSS
jgi:ElaB/YqjD/DUF883 family membrane-anchored ribosome-binding protein